MGSLQMSNCDGHVRTAATFTTTPACTVPFGTYHCTICAHGMRPPKENDGIGCQICGNEIRFDNMNGAGAVVGDGAGSLTSVTTRGGIYSGVIIQDAVSIFSAPCTRLRVKARCSRRGSVIWSGDESMDSRTQFVS